MPKIKKFGTFAGVFTPSILTILGVIMYLRLGWVVGTVGIWVSFAIIAIAHIISVSTGLSISSIATDKKIKTGGIYYILSRSLGLPMGGAIGISLFFGTALSVALYIVGFVESFLSIEWISETLDMTGTVNDIRLVGTIVIVSLVVLAFISTSLAIKTQFFILAAIALSIISVVLGIVFGTDSVPETPIFSMSSGDVNLETVFGIFFPAVTGFTAGVAMSGDLKDPKKNIPAGTLSSIGIGMIVYFSLALLFGFFVDRELLLNDYNFLTQIALWSPLVVAGVWGATLSSALGGILGAPRIMQAMSIDKITPKILGAGHGENNEPRNALILTFLIAEGGILIGKLDTIASVVSMFYLASYGFINLAYWLESWASSDFRPSFKIPRWTGMIGFISCFMVMFQLDMVAMILALIIVLLIYFILKRRQLKLDYGDVWQSVWVSVVRNVLQKIDTQKMEERNWQPNIILFSGSKQKRPYLIDFGKFLVGKYGILSNFELHEEKEYKILFPKYKQSKSQQDRDHKGIFTRQHTCRDVYQGIENIATNYGFSGVEPNTVLMGWARHSNSPKKFVRMLDILLALDLNIVLLDYDKKTGFGNYKLIDIWWRGGSNNGNFALTLAKFIQESGSWQDSKIRLLIVSSGEENGEAMKENASQIFENLRIDVEIKIINNSIEKKPFYDIIRIESVETDLTFLGFPQTLQEGQEEEFVERTNATMHQIGTVALVKASSQFKNINFGADIRLTEIKKEEERDKQKTAKIKPQEVNYPAKQIIALPLIQLHKDINTIYSNFVQNFLTEQIKKLSVLCAELEQLTQASFNNILLASETYKEMNVSTVSRIQKNFIIRAQKILSNYKKNIDEEQKNLNDVINIFVEEFNSLIKKQPQTVIESYTLKDLEAKEKDTRRIKYFKLYRRTLIGIRGETVEYKNNFRKLVQQSLLNESFFSIIEIMEKWGHQNFRTFFELRNTVKQTRNSLLQIENKTLRSVIDSNFVLNNKEKVIELINEIKEELNETTKLLELQWTSNTASYVQGLVETMNALNTNHLIRKNKSRKMRKEVREMKQKLILIPQLWLRNRKLAIDVSVMDIMLLALEDKVRKLFYEQIEQIDKYFNEKGLNEYKEANKYFNRCIELASTKELKILSSPEIPEIIEQEKHFEFFKKLFDIVLKVVRQETSKFPTSINVLSTEGINYFTEVQYDKDIPILSVSASMLVDYILQEELLYPFQQMLGKLPEKLYEQQQKVRGIMRIISLSLDKGIVNNSLSISNIEEKNKELAATVTEIEELKNQLTLNLKKRINDTSDKLTILSFSKIGANFKQYVQQVDSRNKFGRIQKRSKKIMEFINDKAGDLLYRRNNAIIETQDTESIKVTNGNEILGIVEQLSIDYNLRDKLPFYYQQLFLKENTFYPEFWYGRKQETEEVQKALKRYEQGYHGALLILGEQAAGKTSFVKKICTDFMPDRNVFAAKPPQAGSCDINIFRNTMEKLFDDKYENIFKNADLGSIIIFDDMEMWWERTENGFEVINEIIRLTNKYSHKFLFIITLGTFSFKIISKIKPLNGCFISTIILKKFDTGEIKEIVMLRHNSTGVKFAIPKDRHKKLIMQDKMRSLDYASTFNNLTKISKGNVGVALNAWIASIKRFDKNLLEIEIPSKIDISALEELETKTYIYLYQLIIHKQLSAERFANINMEEVENAKRRLNFLRNMGLIIEVEANVYAINKNMYIVIKEILTEKSIL